MCSGERKVQRARGPCEQTTANKTAGRALSGRDCGADVADTGTFYFPHLTDHSSALALFLSQFPGFSSARRCCMLSPIESTTSLLGGTGHAMSAPHIDVAMLHDAHTRCAPT